MKKRISDELRELINNKNQYDAEIFYQQIEQYYSGDFWWFFLNAVYGIYTVHTIGENIDSIDNELVNLLYPIYLIISYSVDETALTDLFRCSFQVNYSSAESSNCKTKIEQMNKFLPAIMYNLDKFCFNKAKESSSNGNELNYRSSKEVFLDETGFGQRFCFGNNKHDLVIEFAEKLRLILGSNKDIYYLFYLLYLICLELHSNYELTDTFPYHNIFPLKTKINIIKEKFEFNIGYSKYIDDVENMRYHKLLKKNNIRTTRSPRYQIIYDEIISCCYKFDNSYNQQKIIAQISCLTMKLTINDPKFFIYTTSLRGSSNKQQKESDKENLRFSNIYEFIKTNIQELKQSINNQYIMIKLVEEDFNFCKKNKLNNYGKSKSSNDYLSRYITKNIETENGLIYKYQFNALKPVIFLYDVLFQYIYNEATIEDSIVFAGLFDIKNDFSFFDNKILPIKVIR